MGRVGEALSKPEDRRDADYTKRDVRIAIDFFRIAKKKWWLYEKKAQLALKS